MECRVAKACLCIRQKEYWGVRRKSRRRFDDEDPLSLLGTVFWMMVGFDKMMCSGFFEG
jgi:hypothetical protein